MEKPSSLLIEHDGFIHFDERGLREGGAGLHRNRSAAGRLDQHFRQTSFAEFTMLMTFDDEVLKRYGLPKSMVERAYVASFDPRRGTWTEKAPAIDGRGKLAERV